MIGGYIVAALIGAPAQTQANLQLLAVLAAGAIFGGVATVNGWKAPVESLHSRVDTAEQNVTRIATVVGVTPVADHQTPTP